MAGILKRIIAVLVSIVWLSLILALLAGFFAPDLHQLLPASVREFTDPQVLRERWQSFTDSLVSGIGVQPPSEPATYRNAYAGCRTVHRTYIHASTRDTNRHAAARAIPDADYRTGNEFRRR